MTAEIQPYSKVEFSCEMGLITIGRMNILLFLLYFKVVLQLISISTYTQISKQWFDRSLITTNIILIMLNKIPTDINKNLTNFNKLE